MGALRQTGVLAAVALLLFSGQALGADADVIQSLQDEFRNETGTWFGPLKNIATWLLISLATIAWTWSAGQMVLRNADLQEFVVELVRLVIFVGFFLALILNADTWSTALINGFMWTGNQVAGTGITGDINPAAILERGFILGARIIEASGRLTFVAFAILALVALVLYALIAAYALLVMAEMYIVTAAGVLLLGFGGSQWTADYAKRYITYCVSVGAKLYVLFLIVGLGEQFIYNWAIGQDKSQFSIVLAILGVLVMLVVLVKMIPDIIQGIINGTSIGSGTPSITGMAAAAGGAAIGATVGAAGSAMAVREASKLAGEQLGGGGAMASAAAPGGGSPAGNSFLGVPAGGPPGGGSSPGAGTGPLPMPGGSSSSGGSGGGRMAHAGQTLKNLGKSAGQTIGGRIMGDYNSTHGSSGGSMAQKMRAERLGMAESGGDSPHTGGQPTGSNSRGMSGSIGPGAAKAAASAAGNAMSGEGQAGSGQPGTGSPDLGGDSSSSQPNHTNNSGAAAPQQQGSSVDSEQADSSNASQPYHSPASRS
jgi:P-type conjugative transfer protein TrbL